MVLQLLFLFLVFLPFLNKNHYGKLRWTPLFWLQTWGCSGSNQSSTQTPAIFIGPGMDI